MPDSRLTRRRQPQPARTDHPEPEENPLADPADAADTKRQQRHAQARARARDVRRRGRDAGPDLPPPRQWTPADLEAHLALSNATAEAASVAADRTQAIADKLDNVALELGRIADALEHQNETDTSKSAESPTE
jgi:conjugal transfer/entry exclusion protein